MSLLSQAYLLDHYGVRMTVDDLSAELHLEPGTIYNQVAPATSPRPC